MSIFEKAFEKLGKDAGEEQTDQLFNSADDLLNIPESLDEDGAGSNLNLADELEPGMRGKGHPQAIGSGDVIKLDLDRLKEAGLVDPRSNKTNRTTEEFRRIKRPLLAHVKGEGATMIANANMIMVTRSIFSIIEKNSNLLSNSVRYPSSPPAEIPEWDAHRLSVKVVPERV